MLNVSEILKWNDVCLCDTILRLNIKILTGPLSSTPYLLLWELSLDANADWTIPPVVPIWIVTATLLAISRLNNTRQANYRVFRSLSLPSSWPATNDRLKYQGIEVLGDLEKRSSNTLPDHFVIVDDNKKRCCKVGEETWGTSPSIGMARGMSVVTQWVCILCSDRAIFNPLRLILFHPSSTTKFVIYRKSRIGISKLKHLRTAHR